jgi:hypothetical protein
MRSRRGVLLIALVVGGAALVARSDEPQVQARGRALLAPFKASLQQALKAGLAEGPVAAVDACRLRAPELAAAASRDGVRVGRASHRLRNPENAAPDWVEPILARYLAEPDARKPTTARLGDGRDGYVEPIVLGPLCSTCHGDAIAPELAARIASLYPEDQAVGFRTGDLRGVFWVELPAETHGP